MGGIGSGRTTNELKKAQQIKTTLELVSNEALIELAKSKVFNQIRQLGRSRKALKNTALLALPILLKSIKEHKQVDIVEVKPLLSAIRGEISEPKQLEESLTANASEVLKEPALLKPKRHRGFYLKDETPQTQYNAPQDPIASKEPQDTTPVENEAIMNE